VHELAITESIVDAVRERVGDTKVRVVRLEVGALSGVVADALRFCFDVCAQGTTLEGARLEIAEIPGRAHCRDCLTTVDLPDLIVLCPCGSANLEVVTGSELRIKNVELGG
jgi:hydrogenase nickel incorporation protein HypA/HybF